MEFLNLRDLKAQARDALSDARQDPRKLVLIHAGVSAVVLLLLTAADFVLDSQIAGTGGLGGMGYRTVLSAAQTLLQTLVSLALPFWEMGYFLAAWKLARREETGVADLTQGFRRAGPVARFLVIKALIFLALGFLCFYPSMSLFLMTPLSRPLTEALEPMMEQMSLLQEEIILDDATLAAVTQAIVPMVGIFGVVYLAVCAPFFYRFRVAEFALWENPQAGALAALRRSGNLTRGHRMTLFRLDLSFWWYYLAQLALALVAYADTILSALGVTLPVPGGLAFFLCYCLYLAGQVVLFYLAKNYVTVTLARAYEALRQPPQQPPAVQRGNVPWTY